MTYRGIQIGKVTKVEPTEHGVRATLSIDDRYKIPIDASANVHSVSAIGEQYVDLVSTGDPGKFFSPGQTITKGTVPSEIGPALDAANRGLPVLPKQKIASLLDETSLAVGGLGPALQRLVDSTQSIVGDFEANLSDVDDIITNAAPILDSQVDSGDSIAQWSRNLKVLTAQIANNDPHLQRVLTQAAPTAEQVNSVFSDVREALPQTIANLEVVADMLKRYNAGLEQLLVFLPEVGSVAQTLIASAPGAVLMNLEPVTEQSAAVSDRIPPRLGVALAGRHQRGAAAGRNLLQDPAGHAGQRRPRSTQLPLRRRPGQAQGDAAGMPRQQAVRAAGHQPLVRRSEPDPELPGTGRPLRPARRPRQGDTGAVGQQRHEPGGGRPAAAAARPGHRPAAAARLGFGALQRPATQPVHLHAGRSDVRSTCRPAAKWWDPTAPSTRWRTPAIPETMGGRTCSRRPADSGGQIGNLVRPAVLKQLFAPEETSS